MQMHISVRDCQGLDLNTDHGNKTTAAFKSAVEFLLQSRPKIC